MYQEKDHSLFIPVLAGFRHLVELGQLLFKKGIVGEPTYELRDLVDTTISTVISVVRNTCYSESYIVLDHFGVFAATDKEITFTPDSYFVSQIYYGLTLSSPVWVDTYRQREELDSELLVAILESELQNLVVEEYATMAAVAYNGLVRAMTWFLVQRKPVVISGLGVFKIDESGFVQYESDPIIKETIGLKKHGEELRQSQAGRVVDLGTEFMPADMVERDIKERRALAEKIGRLVGEIIESSGADQATRDDQIIAGLNKLLEEEFGEGIGEDN